MINHISCKFFKHDGGADGIECNLLVYCVLYSGETVPPSRPSMSEVRVCTLLPDCTVSCARRLMCPDFLSSILN